MSRAAFSTSLLVSILSNVDAFALNPVVSSTRINIRSVRFSSNKEWTSDFDDFYNEEENQKDDDNKFELPDFSLNDDDDTPPPAQEQSQLLESLAQVVSSQKEEIQDLTGLRQRQFFLGQDIQLSGFAGSMGFDEVTDWEYYQQDEDTGERKVVEPPPLDPSKPKRTRERVGSVIRIFRGEFVGMLNGMIRSQGLDARVLVKEFSGDMALDLARAELACVAKLQSLLIQDGDEDWSDSALGRQSKSAMARQDNTRLARLCEKLRDEAPFLGILGEINLDEFQNEDELDEESSMDANEWYRALGVPPPKPNSIWIVYEYAGLSTAQQYCQPALVRRSNLPPKRGVFGTVVQPPLLPKWENRANYVVNGILRGALEAVATLHEAGIFHNSIGRTSLLLSSTAMDKTEAASPFATMPSMLRMKLADFGFAAQLQESTMDEDVRRRARKFGLTSNDEESMKEFCMAEDLHALGFVVLALLFTSLAEPPSIEYNMPNMDDDTLKRQLSDIFGNDIYEFRDYVEAEDEVWANVVQLLDDHDGAGWKVLQSLCLAREDATNGKLTSAREILSSPFFSK